MEYSEFLLKDTDRSNVVALSMKQIAIDLASKKKLCKLFPLLQNDSEYVRLSASTYLLYIDEINALATLEKLKGSDTKYISRTAKFTIMQWTDGSMKDYYDDLFGKDEIV